METSERSWIVVHLEGERIPPEIQGDTGIKWTPFEIRIVNKGKTPAYLIESGHQGVILPRDRPLPDVPGPYEDFGVVKAIEKWGGEGLPLQPNADIIKPSLGAWCKDAGKLQRGFDVLWVYGYVIYRDAFQKRRETHYCVRWNSGAATDHGSSWDQGGPLGYNRAT
jgi:hypothetical protein